MLSEIWVEFPGFNPRIVNSEVATKKFILLNQVQAVLGDIADKAKAQTPGKIIPAGVGLMFRNRIGVHHQDSFYNFVEIWINGSLYIIPESDPRGCVFIRRGLHNLQDSTANIKIHEIHFLRRPAGVRNIYVQGVTINNPTNSSAIILATEETPLIKPEDALTQVTDLLVTEASEVVSTGINEGIYNFSSIT